MIIVCINPCKIRHYFCNMQTIRQNSTNTTIDNNRIVWSKKNPRLTPRIIFEKNLINL